MNKAVKELTGITPLNMPVPPMLSEAMGYKGEARYVSFQNTGYDTIIGNIHENPELLEP
jgi:hypothetical protein